jgi:hypothetical protein
MVALQIASDQRHSIHAAPKASAGESGIKIKVEAISDVRQGLDQMVSFGDVLYIRGTLGFGGIGETGGYWGHLHLVTGKPACIQKHSLQALPFLQMWPSKAVDCIWAVPVIESRRNVAGLTESELLLYVHPSTGRIFVLGEIAIDGALSEFIQDDTPEQVEIWRCPADLRKSANKSLKAQALADLKACGASWSWATAVRAFMLKGEITSRAQKESTIEDFQQCWTAEPICTTVVIAFWQRYLCHLAEHKARHGAADGALAMILRYMPLKADRALPSELLRALRSHQWEQIVQAPLVECPKELRLS